MLVNEGAMILEGNVTEGSLKTLASTIVTIIPGVTHVINDINVASVSHPRVGVHIDWAKGSMALT